MAPVEHGKEKALVRRWATDALIGSPEGWVVGLVDAVVEKFVAVIAEGKDCILCQS